jgi:leucyl-tRNA synthetase
MPYNHRDIESKWIKNWSESNIYKTPEIQTVNKKKYILEAFPYPSGDGLHVGHALPMTAGDITSRFYRMNGYGVLHPMGWDSFGLPTENFAKKKGMHPQDVTDNAIANFTKQIHRLGVDYDWDKELATSDPSYYKWTQWFFQLLYKRGLAYKKEALVNWDPVDMTVLANEQVLADGTAERSGAKVEQKMMSQWFFKITDYAERLLNDLDALDWPESTKLMQKNWIGKSVGAEVEFKVYEENTNFLILHGWEGSADSNFIPKLKADLEKMGYQVQAPNLPGTMFPKELDQVDFILKNCKIDANTIIIGHSLGTVLAMKLLEKIDFKIKKCILVAAFEQPFIKIGEFPFAKDFDWNFDYKKISNSTNSGLILQAHNDSFLEVKEGENLAKKLGFKFVVTQANGGHFCGDSEPEIFNNIFESIKVFTTAHDTIFGVTFVVIAPEHPLVDDLTSPEQFEEIAQYIERSKQKSQFERTEMNKNKTGVFTGSFAINALTGQKVPIWVADYVLTSYGTGAVMAVPGEDERDFEFANKYDLPVVYTNHTGEFVSYSQEIKPNKSKYTLINSGEFNGMSFEEARPKILDKLIAIGAGEASITYRLRDWSIGRQRYWGCPIPVVYSENKSNQTILVDAVNTLFAKNEEELTLNIELAEYLNSVDATKIILTNAKDEVLVKLKDLIKDYGWQVFSLKFEPEKTDPEYYKTVVKEFNLDLNNTIYFDHSLANLESAKVSKINCFQYLSNKQTIELVDDFLNGVKLVPESDLPVILPQDLDLSTGMIKPLRSNLDFINSAATKYGEGWTREGDTMDTFVCSSWYFFRYCSGNIDNAFANPEDMKQWMPVDQYIIGAEHSTMHLLYARFFTKVLHDADYIDFDEPFAKMRHQGLILGPDGAKMSKSKGNVINPNEVFDEYGADTLRMYEMFMGPFDQPKPWSTSSIKGVRRFLDRVWNIGEQVKSEKLKIKNEKVEVALHKLIKKIGEDIETYSFNTCVSEFMKFVNTVEENNNKLSVDQFSRLIQVLAPFAPFVTEELWSIINVTSTTVSPQESVQSIHLQQWPSYDPKMLVENTVTIGVQINGKARGEVELSPTETAENAQDRVMELDFVKRYIEGKTIRKFVYVPARIVNVVVG